VSTFSTIIKRRPIARAAVTAARLSPRDRVIDIGCGPGTAVRYAARQAASATGIDPEPAILRTARRLTRRRNVTFLPGEAEKLPVPDAQATVVWAISSIHHWSDRGTGLAEAARVLTPDGRLLIVEQLKTGENSRGITDDRVDQIVKDVTAAGFDEIRRETVTAGQRTLAIVSGTKRV
jgi:ubiquinone/menaquinone biosynthesis C-methylase UbiE